MQIHSTTSLLGKVNGLDLRIQNPEIARGGSMLYYRRRSRPKPDGDGDEVGNPQQNPGPRLAQKPASRSWHDSCY